MISCNVDVAQNDFSTLFELLDSAPDSHLSEDQDVLPSAVGRSFYGVSVNEHFVTVIE
jgi:hypothetical protein